MQQQRHYGEVTLATAIRRYFDVLLYLLIFTGFGTLASTGRLDLPTVLVVTAALLYRGYALARRRQTLLPARWTTLCTLSALLFLVFDEFLISRAFLGAVVHFLLFLMLVRLFSAQTDRDRYLLAALSFAMVLAAAVLTVDVTFLLALAGFVLVAIATFIAMEMLISFEKAPVVARPRHLNRAYRKLSFSIAGVASVLLLLVALSAAAIFLVLPRASAGFMSAQNGANDITTGFADQVELGRIGQIQQSSTVVAHLELAGNGWGAAAPKLRGVTLNLFDGHSWTNTSPRARRTREKDGRFNLALDNPTRKRGAHVLHYRVVMEPYVSEVFFLVASPKSLTGNYGAVAEDSEGDVFNLDGDHPVTSYEADSELNGSDPGLEQSSVDTPDSYLQLPPLDRRIQLLAQKIVLHAPTPYDRARAIEAYLQTHYGYTLELPSNASVDPIADFLFQRGRGHCEFFASAMAVMLRTVGVRSRVVNGFAGGEFNDITSQYVIRARDAHSWVEAYIPGRGWTEFDPTPSGSGQVRSPWDRVLLYTDALSSVWREWVVNYDFSHQMRLTQDASRGSRGLVSQAHSWARSRYRKALAWARRALRELSTSSVKWGVRLVALVAILLLGFNFPRLLKAFRRLHLARRPERSPQMFASIWYERMLQRTAKQGWKKSACQTPEEFTSTIADQQLKNQVVEFTQYYERARFGGSGQDACRLPELYEKLTSSR